MPKFLKTKDLKNTYEASKSEARVWRSDYSSFERLMNNDLMDGLDPNLPEVNDGSLAAALFKLPKRIVNSKLSGTVKVTNRDEAWLAELANIEWRNEIVPHANSQAPFHRKWKDAIRKAAGYGSVPLITLFVETEGKRHADFIVAQPQDVTLEPGKVSDYDSDVQFWDIYYSRLQVENMIEQAKEENKQAAIDKKKYEADRDAALQAGKKYDKREPKPYNDWDIQALQEILDSKQDDEAREGSDQPKTEKDNQAIQKKGIKFCIAVQKGVNAPYYMYHYATNKTIRSWTNPDPTGDTCIHFLYCYQDFINPYGIGIVKLAGGTQNVLDYMRQADVLATQIGLEPPIEVNGDAESADLDSFVYAKSALWFSGQATVKRMELSNVTYQGLPDRMAMYKTSLNQLIPTGDTSIAAGSGDPQYSKTPAGVKFQGAQLSIDDEDFKDNLYMTYAAVAKSMINTHFANMQGKDLRKLNDDERDLLRKAGMEFEEDENGEISNEIEIIWDTVRAEFDFEVDPEADKAKDDADKLEGLMKVAELTSANPALDQDLLSGGKKLNKGELFSEIIKLTSDNDKIVTDIDPEEEAQQGAQIDPQTGKPPVDPQTGQPIPQGGQSPQPDPVTEQKLQQNDELHQVKMEKAKQDMLMKADKHDVSMQPKEQPPEAQNQDLGMGQIPEEEMKANMAAVMAEWNVDEETALMALAAERQNYPIEGIIEALKARQKELVA